MNQSGIYAKNLRMEINEKKQKFKSFSIKKRMQEEMVTTKVANWR